ncbi:SDR family NAD(P)-dependent oxidoreductase [Rhodococcus erythropolis]|uniref:SDR family NAD(P)-dependent oxidoreductase n=1 Tax=Rhodococcus erythropolis TaxID=1833 RepID=UPI00222707E2|nr:SDR family NAD(P)-dependent oxidoreductase [Rhodococcus erythropolis]MCW2295426.1 NAD(P)-dependent dehydrogenase (short-subunit alcohol dehydrogenase family) [Rhodococcus erythropolis]
MSESAASVTRALPPIMNMTGRKVLVTGAARGIGAETARAFAQLGADLVITDLRDIQQTVDDVTALGVNVTAVEGDLTDSAVVTALFEHGPFFSLAHVAGTAVWPKALTPDERFELLMRVNVQATMLVASAAIEQMAEVGEGYVVLVGSLAGRSGGTVATTSLGHAAYTASKGAVHSLVRWHARNATPRGVRVNGVAPGGVDTPMTQGKPFDENAFPLGRMGRADELGWSIALLGTPVAGNTAGAILDVNGGVWVG